MKNNIHLNAIVAMTVRAGRAALHLAGQRSGDLPLPHGQYGHTALDTKAVNEPSRIFTVPGEGPY